MAAGLVRWGVGVSPFSGKVGVRGVTRSSYLMVRRNKMGQEWICSFASKSIPVESDPCLFSWRTSTYVGPLFYSASVARVLRAASVFKNTAPTNTTESYNSYKF